MIKGANLNARNLRDAKGAQPLPDTWQARLTSVPDSDCQNSKRPLVWLLLGNRPGDNNQLFALSRALGFAFEPKNLDFNQARWIPFLRSGLTIVASHSRTLIAPPWPDVVVGVGYTSVPVARYIREQTGGRAKLVHIGNPRARLDDFDLQITTPQYSRAAPNLIELPFPIGNPARDAVVTPQDRQWLSKFPRPRRLVAIGGPARHWELDHDALAHAIRLIQHKSPRGSLIAVTSNRTGPATRKLLERLVAGPHESVVDDKPPFGTLLAESDEIFVTADSVSMLSEAILSGKPVGIIPIVRSLRGTISHILWELPTRRRALPDFQNFWNLLRQENLIGTVEHPVASQVSDTVDRAARAVRSLLPAGEVGAEPKG